jgi:hypothetical protein
MIKLKNLYLALKYQLPWTKLLRRIFTGTIKGLLSKRSHYRSNGNTKVRYNTEETAKKSADRLQVLNDIHFAVYRCIYCGGFHVGANRHRMNKEKL